MKRKYLVLGLSALTIIAATAGATTVMAAGNGSGGFLWGKHQAGAKDVKVGVPQNLTAEQEAALQAKLDAVKSALNAGDYNAWVTAEKALNDNSPILKKVTAANFSTYVAEYKAQEAKITDRQTKEAAVKAALEAGDYNAWVTAEKALNANAPVLQKINADNFSQYVQAYKLETQAQTILTGLGLPGNGMGKMMGAGPDFGSFGEGRLKM